MLHENLKALRKQRGLSQEELAAQLHIVRQTVSKWEMARSVPDAEMLCRLAEVLEVPVGVLLGENIPEDAPRRDVAEELARLNEQLAQKNRRARRVLKTAAAVLIGLMVLGLLILLLSRATSVREGSVDVQSTAWTLAAEP